MPIPQSLASLDAGRFEVPADLRMRLEAIRFERCLAVMAGDAFAGPTVEGAARSGWAATEILLNHLSLS